MSVTTHDEALLLKITKLLNLASNNPSENEAHLAMIKAQEMMLGENITMADIAAFDGESRTKIEATYGEYHCDTGSHRTATWRAFLGWWIAKAMGGKAIRTPSQGRKSWGDFELGKMTFFALGNESLESMIEIYRYIELQLDLMSAREMRNRPTSEEFDYRTGQYKQVRRNGRAWRLAWLAGAVERLKERLEEQYKIIEEQGDNKNALVLVRNVVNEKVKEIFPHTVGTPARYREYNPQAFAAGRAGADRVDLGGTKLGQQSQRALPA